MNFLHHHASQPCTVDDVVRQLQISRRSLEIRFRRAVGRSLNDEIQRLRLERAKRLLVETDLPLSQVAESAGYGTPSYLTQVFRKRMHTTPARFRRQARTG